MTAFVIVGLIGLGLLVVTSLIGDVFDALDIGDIGISWSAFSATLVAFGAIGVITQAAGLDLMLSFAVAFILAIGAGAATQHVIDRIVASSDGDAAINAVDLTGITTTTVTPEGGEVRLDGSREVESRLAWSDEPIPANTRVRVLNQSGSRVKVAPAVAEG